MKIVRFLVLLIAILALLAVLLGTLFGRLLVQNKSLIEQALSDRLAAPVQIGHVEVRWGWVGPAFELSRIRIATGQRPASPLVNINKVELTRIDLDIDLVSSLLDMNLDIASLSLVGLAVNGVVPQPVIDHLGDYLGKAGGAEPHDSTQLSMFRNLPRRLSLHNAIVTLQNDQGVLLTQQVVNLDVHRRFNTVAVQGAICPQDAEATACLLSIRGEVKMDGTGLSQGSLAVQGHELPVIIPPLYSGQIKAQELTGKVSFQRDTAGLVLQLSDLHYVDRHVQVTGHVNVGWPSAGGEPNLDLLLAVDRADAEEITRYIPQDVLPPSTTAWLKRSLRAGTIEHGVVKIRGNLADIPRHDGDKNIFEIALQLKHGILRFDPAWPQIDELFAAVAITPDRLQIEVEEGRSHGVSIGKSTIILPNFADPDVMLNVSLQLETDAGSSYQYLKSSPLADSLALFWQKVESPRAKIALSLAVPLAASSTVPLRGFVAFKGLGIKYKGTVLALAAAEGRIDFTEDTLGGRAIKGTVMGMPIVIDVTAESFRRHKPIIAKIRGRLSSKALLSAGFIDPSPYFAGETAVSTTVVIAQERKGIATDFDIRSDLAGMAIDLPKVYSKTREQMEPLRVHAVIDPQARLTVQASIDGKWKSRLSSGPDFDFQRGFAGYFYGAPYPGEVKTAPGTFTIYTPLIQGRITRQPGAAGKLLAAFDKVEIITKDVGDDAPSTDNVSTKFPGVPDAVLTIADLRFNASRITNFRAVVSSGERGLDIQNMAFVMGDTTVNIAKATWQNTPQGAMTTLMGRLVTANFGELLNSQESLTGVNGLQGEVDFSLHWSAKPWLFDRKNLAGEVNLDLTKGTLKNANTAIYRIVNVITLQFQQAVKKDLEIKVVKGRLNLAGGSITTDKFSIDLSGAQADLQGGINLLDETIDSKVMLTVDISRMLQIGVAFAINPVLGGIYWWKGNARDIAAIDNLTRHGYTIKGPWREPKVSILPIFKL